VHRYTLERQEEWGRRTADRLWGTCDLSPDDVDVAGIYDGFSILTILWLEAMGFAPTGQGFEFIQGGTIAPDGALPLNTAGGSLGAGRMHGVPQLMDTILQVTGRSGPRQVPGARTGVVTIGPLSFGSAFLLSGDEP
jgi:acetyl-CoA acetyltransferase